MPGRVDEVEQIRVPVARRVMHGNGVALNRDAFFALEIHRVEQLIFHLALFDGFCVFEETIGERRLPVVNVRDDAKVANMANVRH